MTAQLQSLKSKITQIRGKKERGVRFPRSVWDEVWDLSKDMPLKDICQFIGLDHQYARLKFNKLSSSEKSESPQILQVPIYDNPITPIMELSLPSGAIIKVFSA